MFETIDKDPNNFRMYRTDWRTVRSIAEKIVLEINKTYKLPLESEEYVGKYVYHIFTSMTRGRLQESVNIMKQNSNKMDEVVYILKKKLLSGKTIMHEVTKVRGVWKLTGETVEYSAHQFCGMTQWNDIINGKKVLIWSLVKQGHGYIENTS